VAGQLYALSTAGSLLGTFLPALVLIPAIGTQRTFLVVAALIALSSCFLLGARYLVVAALLAALVAVPPGIVKPTEGLIHEETSYHQYIQVVERDDGRRLLHLNEGVAVHSLWRPDSVLTGGVWDAFLALPPLLGRPLERVAILGNAAGTTARALGVYYPEADVDGVELDPAVSRVGRRYFGMEDNPRLTVHDADARPYLRSTDERYDLIIVDAYHQPYVPFYLATREFFALVRERLAPDGIVALNVAAVPDDKRLVHAIGRTMAAELPQVLEWPALRFNSIVLGLTQPLTTEELRSRLRKGPDELAVLRDLLARDASHIDPSGTPWTDDRAPVEWLTDRMIVSYAAEGGRLEEDYLPTRPKAP
jgi:spermidine synthase